MEYVQNFMLNNLLFESKYIIKLNKDGVMENGTEIINQFL